MDQGIQGSGQRITQIVLVGFGAFFALVTLSLLVRSEAQLLGWAIASSFAAVALLFFLGAGGLSRPSLRRNLAFGAIGGAVVGSIGLCGGFFLPLVFHPEANQGPLLGFIFTGPLGFAIGVFAGAALGSANLEPSDETPSHP